MAEQQPNPQMFAGVDFSQYPSWQKVVTPRGAVLYVVPGTGWVYDPFLSAAKGRPVLSPNPQQEIDDRQRVIDNQNANTRAQSPEGQIIPVFGGVAGTVGGAAAYNYISNSGKPSPTIDPQVDAQVVVNPTPPPATSSQGFVEGAQTGASVAPVGNTIPAGSPVPAGYTAVGTNPDGGTLVAPTSQVNAIPEEALNDPGFLSSVNWGQVVQGGLGLAQLYGAYRGYQKGDYVGAGLSGATGAGNIALATGVASQGGTMATQVIPGLNIATGLYTGYQTADAMGDMAAGGKRTRTGVIGGASSGAAIGAGVGSLFFGAGAAPGAAIGAVVGAIAGLAGDKFGSSKGKAQFMRDGIRTELQKGGILDENYQGTLADGTKYDFGKDGSTLKWKEIDKVAAENKNAWDAAVPLGDALSAGYGFVGQKASDITAWYSKAAVSNAGDDPEKAKANMRHFARQQGITYEGIKQKLDEAKADNRIDEAQYNYYLGGAQQLNEGNSPQPPQMQKQGVAPIPGTPQAPARSKTISPGIDLQGRRVNYSDMGKQLANRMNKRGR